MDKVFCVRVPEDWKWAKRAFGFDYPEVGTECEVENKSICSCGRHQQYQLAGFPYMLYADYCFATLPGLSADEINQLEKESILL